MLGDTVDIRPTEEAVNGLSAILCIVIQVSSSPVTTLGCCNVDLTLTSSLPQPVYTVPNTDPPTPPVCKSNQGPVGGIQHLILEFSTILSLIGPTNCSTDFR